MLDVTKFRKSEHVTTRLWVNEAESKFKKMSQTTQLTESFKTSTISWGFGILTHGRVVTLQFIERGFESQAEFKFLQNP